MKVTTFKDAENQKTPKKVIPKHLYFAMIFEYFLFLEKLGVGPKALLAVLHAKAFRNKNLLSGKGQAIVPLAGLAAPLGVTGRTIQNWLKELIAVEAIRVKSQKRLHKANIYTLLVPPYVPKASSVSAQDTTEEIRQRDLKEAGQEL